MIKCEVVRQCAKFNEQVKSQNANFEFGEKIGADIDYSWTTSRGDET